MALRLGYMSLSRVKLRACTIHIKTLIVRKEFFKCNHIEYQCTKKILNLLVEKLRQHPTLPHITIFPYYLTLKECNNLGECSEPHTSEVSYKDVFVSFCCIHHYKITQAYSHIHNVLHTFW